MKLRADSLSGGEQQMLADPKMVVLDEASLGLAPLVVDRIFETPHQIAPAGVRACPATPHGSRRDLLRT
jgi:branched-chain amino acid transport system ATP-binding protein